jgi:arylsulfatase A
MTSPAAPWRPALLLAAWLLGLSGLHAAGLGRPNLVFILADDMGRGDLSAYNPHSAWHTPHLDELAHQGMTFSDAHSASAVCSPSRYCILTGRYSWRSSLKQGVGSGFSKAIIEPGRMTVASFLKSNGYRTGMVGKWHLGLNWAGDDPSKGAEELDPTDGEPQMRGNEVHPPRPRAVDYSQPFRGGPTDVGFDSFLGIAASLDMPPYVWLRNDRAINPPDRWLPKSPLPAMWRAGPQARDFAPIDVLPRLVRSAVGFIGRQRDVKEPFFLYVALTAPHTPIIPADGFKGRTHTTEYGDFCVQVDDAVGQVLAALEENNLAENTLVVFTSDNGCSPSANFAALKKLHHDPQMGLRGEKADIYEGGHRIPFMVRWPGRVAAGISSDQVICQGDFFATCCELLGATLPPQAGEDSVSFLPAILQRDGGKPLREAIVHHSINGSFAIRQGPWKLCLCPDSGGWSDPKPGHAPAGSPPYQLFNLENDPAETRNVSTDNPAIVRRLGLRLKHYILSGRSTPGPTQFNDGGNEWPQLKWMNDFR